MTTDPQTAADWYEAGCARDCSEQHTYTWGRCALAPESAKPEPTISVGRVETMSDGYPGIVMRSVPLSAWDALITVSKWVSRGKSFALDADPEIAPCYPDASARRALGALHEAGLLDQPATPAVSPLLDQTLRDRIAAALDTLQGTVHYLPPKTRQRVEEVVAAAVPPPADRAAVLRVEAALVRAHCPDHLDGESAEGSWIDCHCDVADDMERRAAEAQAAEHPTLYAQTGIDTPGCDCGHDGMGMRWHREPCAWLAGLVAEAREVLAKDDAAEAQQPDTDGAGEPAELRTLPREVRRLVHAVDRMRSEWAEAPEHGPERRELWTEVHSACDAVWDRIDTAVPVQPAAADTSEEPKP